MKVSVMLLSVSSSFTPKSWVALATVPHSLVCCSMEGRRRRQGQVLGQQAGPACSWMLRHAAQEVPQCVWG